MSQNRLGNIDALRALAALTVYVQHVFMNMVEQAGAGAGPVSGFASGTLDVIDLGRLGVVTFFLVSGFVVPYSIKPDRPVLSFATSRAFRLYPAFWVSLILAGVVFSLGRAPSLDALLANGTMAATVLGQEWVIGVYWTLFIEMLFYVGVISLFIVGLLYRPWMIAAVAAGLAMTTVVPIFLPDAPLPMQYIGLHLSILFSGLLLRLGLLEGKRSALVLAALVFVVQMGCVLVASDYALQTERGFASHTLLATTLAYPLAFGVFIAVATLVRTDTRFLGGLAAISYSFYLLHEIVIQAVLHIAPTSGGWGDLLSIAVSLALTLAGASLVYRWVERPGMALGRRLLNWRGKAPVGVPV